MNTNILEKPFKDVLEMVLQELLEEELGLIQHVAPPEGMLEDMFNIIFEELIEGAFAVLRDTGFEKRIKEKFKEEFKKDLVEKVAERRSKTMGQKALNEVHEKIPN